jgi:hypothetical protein
MATEESEQVMGLLKELSILKEKDIEFENMPTESGRGEHLLRQQRKEEIMKEIKALAEQKKNEDQPSPNTA